ncbi:MAG: Gfo/Idh/MocA family oxidoreductase [Chthonomonas sp.]|nr:Gfo/Idh/MocA family oxidoreductase [Chthonomonas sp.]
MRIAAIGAGAWGKNIVRTLAELGHLACVVEVSPSLREQIAQTYPNLPVFSDPAEAYDEVELDAVAVATPAQFHFDVAAEALERGKHCFVEKPITLASREAEGLCDLAERQNRTLMVGHLLLFQPAVQFLRDQIQSGAIGDLVSIHQERLNLGRARKVENVLWSLGVHDVAVAQYLVGERPLGVTASGLAYLTPDIEDDFYLHVDFPSGVQTHLHCSWLWPTLRRRTVVIGSKGMLVYQEQDQTVTLHRKSIGDDLQNVNDGEEVVFSGSSEPLKLEMQHFVECCQTGATPRADGRSAVEVVRVLEMASATDFD